MALRLRCNCSTTKFHPDVSCLLRPRPYVSGYFWIHNFFFPNTPSVHTCPANSLANLKLFECALQSGYFLIRYESATVWTLNLDFFFYPDDVTRSSPVPCREINSQDGCQRHFCFFMARALLPLFPWGVLSIRVNSDTFRIPVDFQIRFEYAMCGWEYFLIRKEKVAGLQISGYVCTGPKSL